LFFSHPHQSHTLSAVHIQVGLNDIALA